MDIFSARLAKNFYQDYKIKSKENKFTGIKSAARLPKPCHRKTKTEINKKKRRKKITVKSITLNCFVGGEKYHKQTLVQLAHRRTQITYSEEGLSHMNIFKQLESEVQNNEQNVSKRNRHLQMKCKFSKYCTSLHVKFISGVTDVIQPGSCPF